MSEGSFQSNWNPPQGFDGLTLCELPPLREGYTWMEVGGSYEPVAINGPMNDPVTVRMYGPDAQGRFNYNFYQQGRLIGSRAFTRPTGGNFQGVPGAGRNDFPMWADYVNPVTGESFVRGHNVDFVDTAQPPGTAAQDLSTMDPLNFTPEEADWGIHVRRMLVGEIRSTSGAQGQYRQMEFYDPASTPRFTVNGRRIPDGVYFAEYNSVTGQPVRAYLVRYSQSAGLYTGVGSQPCNSPQPVAARALDHAAAHGAQRRRVLGNAIDGSGMTSGAPSTEPGPRGTAARLQLLLDAAGLRYVVDSTAAAPVARFRLNVPPHVFVPYGLDLLPTSDSVSAYAQLLGPTLRFSALVARTRPHSSCGQ